MIAVVVSDNLSHVYSGTMLVSDGSVISVGVREVQEVLTQH
jgi:hypothetical protein